MRSKSDFGVSAPGPGCSVVLTHTGDRKIDVIKTICQLTGLGLAEVKALVDRVPSTIKSGIGADEAERIKAKLAKLGARVVIGP
jgi:large subunit ribosomal protein L7/L12